MVYVDDRQIRRSVRLNSSIKLGYVSRFYNHVTQVRPTESWTHCSR